MKQWLDILALNGALLGLVVILCPGAFAYHFIVVSWHRSPGS